MFAYPPLNDESYVCGNGIKSALLVIILTKYSAYSYSNRTISIWKRKKWIRWSQGRVEPVQNSFLKTQIELVYITQKGEPVSVEV